MKYFDEHGTMTLDYDAYFDKYDTVLASVLTEIYADQKSLPICSQAAELLYAHMYSDDIGERDLFMSLQD